MTTYMSSLVTIFAVSMPTLCRQCSTWVPVTASSAIAIRTKETFEYYVEESVTGLLGKDVVNLRDFPNEFETNIILRYWFAYL